MLLDGHKNYIMKANCFYLLILLLSFTEQSTAQQVSALPGSSLTTHLLLVALATMQGRSKHLETGLDVIQLSAIPYLIK